MVSAWWLLVAFWVGSVLGLLLGAVAATARHPRDDADDEGPVRHREERGTVILPPGSQPVRGGGYPRG